MVDPKSEVDRSPAEIPESGDEGRDGPGHSAPPVGAIDVLPDDGPYLLDFSDEVGPGRQECEKSADSARGYEHCWILVWSKG